VLWGPGGAQPGVDFNHMEGLPNLAGVGPWDPEEGDRQAA
jgi:hypothetical protein